MQRFFAFLFLNIDIRVKKCPSFLGGITSFDGTTSLYFFTFQSNPLVYIFLGNFLSAFAGVLRDALAATGRK